GPRPPDIDGLATGTAELKIAHIEWALSPIVQVADGESEINWEVKLVNDYGELVDMEVTFTLSAVNVSPAVDWTISPESGPGPDLWGTVVSADPSQGQLKVAYNYFGKAKDSVSDPMWFVQVDRLQYRLSATNAWADMPDPLYVCKNKAVDFKAIKKPNTAPSWPSGKPVWGGQAAGSGVDETTVSGWGPGTNYVTAECGNTVTGKVVVVTVELESVRLPNDFIAIPDQWTHSRIGGNIDQQTVTEVELTFSILPDGIAVDSLKAEFKFKKNGNKVTEDLSSRSGLHQKEKVSVTLGQANFESSGDKEFDVTLLYSVGNCTDCKSNTKTVLAKRLVYRVDMKPKAYATSFCPYTDEHNVPGESALDIPQEKFWGLVIDYRLGGDLKGHNAPAGLEEKIKGSSEGMTINVADKDLNVLYTMKQKSRGAKQAKWEGFDSRVDEPAGEPYHWGWDRTRRENIYPYYEKGFVNKVPDTVKDEREQALTMTMTATADPDPNPDLKQEHKIMKIPVTVRYNYR
ncbi:MAG: hypothetical protein KKE37_03730, partial [Verrucomicrobia bacterium]|nr:hypothetical protein [Verrucomicrobiota bacterium]